MTSIFGGCKHKTIILNGLLSVYFNTKILAQFAKTQIMTIEKILNTDTLNQNIKQNMFDKKARFFLF